MMKRVPKPAKTTQGFKSPPATPSTMAQMPRSSINISTKGSFHGNMSKSAAVSPERTRPRLDQRSLNTSKYESPKVNRKH